MNKLPSPLRILVLCLCTLALSSIAQAQKTLTYVGANGNDANPCTISQPCRTFAVAHNKTAAGGEIIALDSVGYGPVTITKAITILAPLSVHAEVANTNQSGSAISIKAGPSDAVVLRNLNILGHRGGQIGIDFTSGGTLSIEKCLIDGKFSEAGIFAVNRNPAGSLTRILISDTIVRNSGRFGATFASPGNGRLEVTVDRSLFENNELYGLGGNVNTIITVRDSIASGNHASGLYVAFPGTIMNVENCVVTNNTAGGIHAFESALVRVSHSTITDNYGPGLLNNENDATIETRGNNTVRGNSPNVSGTITPIAGT